MADLLPSSAGPLPRNSVASTSRNGDVESRIPHLDMVRGLAALAVVLWHLRGFFMVDYAKTSHGLAVQLAYFISGLHHQAVMVFFVLSGFLVGGSVIRQYRAGRFQWSGYLLRRLSRLWIVIVPALILTALWDSWGAQLVPNGYAGVWHGQLNSGPDASYDLSAGAYLGNILFLQTTFVPSYGSNGPLWSLAYEFWYYILFPLWVQMTLGAGTPLRRVCAALLFFVLMVVLPRDIVVRSVIWLFGVGAFLMLDHAASAKCVSRWPFAATAGVALAVFLIVSRSHPGGYDDFLIGCLVAMTVPWMASAQSRFQLYRRVGYGLSEMSYTLYLVHFPLLAWLYFVFLAPAQFAFGGVAFAWLALILVGVFACAWATWWVFERNTHHVRRWAEMQLAHLHARFVAGRPA